jgi:uncharacterized membrane protein
MAITEVARNAYTANGSGKLELAFTWTNFGYQQGNELRIDDVFNGSTGRWFPSLEANQTLVVTVPTGYDISTAPGASIQDQTLRWEGPYTYGPNTPRIIYVTPVTVTSTTPGSVTPTNSTVGPGPNEGEGSLLVPILIVLLGGALAVIAYVATRTDGPLVPTADEDDDGAGTGTDGSGGPPPAAASTTDADGATTPGQTAASPEEEATESESTDDIDEELLSDEERVERLIEQNGGRMKQANIVNETGWSNAKVSQLLSAMAEEGRIEKLRIGRENLISFPDEDIEDS